VCADKSFKIFRNKDNITDSIRYFKDGSIFRDIELDSDTETITIIQYVNSKVTQQYSVGYSDLFVLSAILTDVFETEIPSIQTSTTNNIVTSIVTLIIMFLGYLIYSLTDKGVL
jgi:hypothetical protein